ncbi:hypothetical protein JHW43_009644 [Diplocarpon mali]|nr:hypothetical protein JHW43_009644 [Diplocarpon mali]
MLTSSLASQKHRIFASDEDGAATPTPTGRPVSLSGQRAEPSRAAQHSTARGAQHRKRCRCRQFLVRGFCFMLGPPPGAGTGRARTGWGGGEMRRRGETPLAVPRSDGDHLREHAVAPRERVAPQPQGQSLVGRRQQTPTNVNSRQGLTAPRRPPVTPAISAVCGVRVQA